MTAGQADNSSRDAALPAWPDDVTLLSPGESAATCRSALLPVAIPGYEIVRELHRGGQGVVYETIQKSTKRTVALKLLREGPFASPAERARFEREVEILAQLNHPNIVTIHDSGVAADCHYFVMDYIPGVSLDRYILGGPHPLRETLDLFARICEALDAAHQRGVIHRDLKPGNIMIDPAGSPHILDFGLAKINAALAEPSTVTQVGQFLGSLPWASPEQAEAESGAVDVRSDVYALGVILYQLLTGRFPYEITGPMRVVLERIVHAEPVRLRALRRGLDADLETIAAKCLAKARERRYPSAAALAQDIRHYLAGEPIVARRDSALYVAHKRLGRFVRRHPLGTWVLILLVATGVAQELGVRLVYEWTPAQRYFTRYVSTVLPPSADALDRVRVIAIDDALNPRGLARVTGLDGDCLELDQRCLRAAHGQLMSRLAGARPAVVAWDIEFGGTSRHDAAFLEGVQALRANGTPVVVAIRRWAAPGSDAFKLCPAIAEATSWGCTPSGYNEHGPWHAALALQRGPSDPLPSLAIAAFSACRQPRYECDLRLDPRDEDLVLLYREPADRAAHGKSADVAHETVRLSAVRPCPEAVPEFGIEPGDTQALYLLPALPADTVLQAATIEYARVFSANEAELRAWFGGRVVFIGDRRHGQGLFKTPDGRAVWGTYAHAIAVDCLLREAGTRVPLPATAALITLAGAAAGVGLGWSLARRVAARSLAVAGALGLAIVLCCLAFVQAQLLYNPLIAGIALLLASELSAGARRAGGPLPR